MSLRGEPLPEPEEPQRSGSSWAKAVTLLSLAFLGIVVVLAIAVQMPGAKKTEPARQFGEWTLSNLQGSRGHHIVQRACADDECEQTNTIFLSCVFITGANNTYHLYVLLGERLSRRIPRYAGEIVDIPFKVTTARRRLRTDVVKFRLYSDIETSMNGVDFSALYRFLGNDFPGKATADLEFWLAPGATVSFSLIGLEDAFDNLRRVCGPAWHLP